MRWLLVIWIIAMPWLPALGHIEVASQYFIKQKEGVYQLWVTLKTHNIQQQIVSMYPELEGHDMNGQAFKEATLQYLVQCINISIDDKTLQLTGESIGFGGRTATAILTFDVNGASSVQLNFNCFAESDLHVGHEVLIGGGAYQQSKTLRAVDDVAIIDLNDMTFLDHEPVVTQGGLQLWAWTLVGLLAISGVAILRVIN